MNEVTHAYHAGHARICGTSTADAITNHAGVTRNRSMPARMRANPRAPRQNMSGRAGALSSPPVSKDVMPPLWHASSPSARCLDVHQKDEEEPEPEKPPEEEP